MIMHTDTIFYQLFLTFHSLLDSGKFMDGREGNDYAAKVSLSGLGKGSSLAARNLGKSRLGGL